MRTQESKERGMTIDEEIILDLIRRAPAITRITPAYFTKFTAMEITDIDAVLKSLEHRQLVDFHHGEWELR